MLIILPLCFVKGKKGTRSILYFSSLSLLESLGSKPKNLAGGFQFPYLSIPILFLTFALARPQSVTEYHHHPESGIDIVLAIDVSRSMDTEDFFIDNYRVDRLEAARETAINFIKKRPNDRIGIVAFAGKPFLVSGLTPTHSFLPFLIKEQVKSSDLVSQGTAIGSAIGLSSLRLNADDKQSKSKIIILLTDGESNSGNLQPLQAAQLAKDTEIKVYTVAIGSEEGRLPGQPTQNFDPVTLDKIAKLTGGQFFIAESTTALDDSFSSIDQLEKVETKVDIYRKIHPYHYYFSLLALVFFVPFLVKQALHFKNNP